MKNKIRALGFSAKLVLNLHDLNNEGTDGIATIPRRVGILYPTEDGSLGHTEVGLISGEINKHFFLRNLLQIALGWDLPLSPAARILDPKRIDSSQEFDEFMESKPSNADIADYFLTCSITDVAGVMLTRKGNFLRSRDSTIDFGLAPALPGLKDTRNLKHSRHPSYGKYDNGNEGNSDPSLFIVPVSSAIYAFIARLDVSRIGFNEIKKSYPLEVAGVKIDRALRFRAALTALAYSFINPDGAKTTTHLPHSAVLEGFFSVSTGATPGTLKSPVFGADLSEVEEQARKTNILLGYEVMKIYPFQGENQLLQAVIDILEQYEP